MTVMELAEAMGKDLGIKDLQLQLYDQKNILFSYIFRSCL